MPLAERIEMLNDKLGLFDSCVKKYIEMYLGHLEACHEPSKIEWKKIYSPVSDGIEPATKVRMLDEMVKEYSILIVTLSQAYDEHLEKYY
jgi:hypothetical protein